MAKNNKSMDKALDKAIEDLLKDEKNAMKKAIKFAVKQAKEDFRVKANSCLMEYYNEYSPKSYDRTHSLQHSFLPYEKIVDGDGSIEGSVGIQYSASALDKYVYEHQDDYSWERPDGSWHGGYYGSRKDFFQPVDSNWVINNYLEGIHPTTENEYTEYEDYGRDGQKRMYKQLVGSTYIPVKVGRSSNEKMQEFIDKYGEEFDQNVLLGIMAQLDKKL